MSTKPHWNLGKRSYNWKGGKVVNVYGYIEVWNPQHPNAKKSGYVLEHRKIMSEHLGRPLETNEEVHHKNGNKKDNRIENLELLDKREHTVRHHLGQPKRPDEKLPCAFPDCEKLTLSKFRLCTYHYRHVWAMVRDGRINSISEHPHLLEPKGSDSNESAQGDSPEAEGGSINANT